VTGAGFIALASTLSAVPHVPVAALALILGIDRFMSEARALTSLVGNGVATLAISRWEGDLDMAKAQRELNHRAATVVSISEPVAPEPVAVAVAETRGGH
jgi:aerobic C4-dicarboxylate transport protein